VRNAIKDSGVAGDTVILPQSLQQSLTPKVCLHSFIQLSNIIKIQTFTMLFTYALFSLLPLLAVATPIDLTHRDESPPSDSVKISGSPQTSGSGCPQGTVSTSISDDRSTVTFGFDAFQAYIGPSESYRSLLRA